MKLLIEERRTRHREMANKHKIKRSFQPGDLVLVRKQVTSKAAEGEPAKLTLKARGPCRALEAAGENSYFIQKLPAVQSLTKRPGKKMKELAMRMEKLPSSLVAHKRVATMDTKLAEMGGELVSNPLERNLGFYDFGRYTTAPGDADYAFEKMNDLWDEEIEGDDSDDESNSDAEDDEMDIVADIAETRRPSDEDKDTTRHANQGHSDRKRLKRKQNEDQDTATPEKRTKRMESARPADWLKEMWKEISISVDKLMIVKRKDKQNQRREAWYLAQVDLDETNERRAKKVGEHHARCYIRNWIDAKKRLVRNCKHWPLIRELKPDGSFGDIVVIKPQKVEETLAKKAHTRAWYQEPVNLAEDGIVGPFNFTPIDGETHQISERVEGSRRQ